MPTPLSGQGAFPKRHFEGDSQVMTRPKTTCPRPTTRQRRRQCSQPPSNISSKGIVDSPARLGRNKGEFTAWRVYSGVRALRPRPARDRSLRLRAAALRAHSFPCRPVREITCIQQ
jgi:hypothetical protein